MMHVRHATAYNDRGLRTRATSYLRAGGVGNEVKWTYNAFNQPVTEAQAHGGEVDGATPKLQYAYEDGGANTIRRTQLKMVGGTEQNYHYASGLANELSRPSSIREGGTDIATYRYLGLGSVVGVEYPEPAVALTYQHAGTGDGGDAYTGLDRFGRITDLRWNKGGAALVSSQYGYDRDSNQRWRKDAAATAAGKGEDQMFWYDGLQQVYQRQRGTLTPGSPPYAGITSLQQTEVFSFDETGNWLGDYNSTGGTSGGVLSQSRTHNVANEITSLTNHTAPFSPVQPVYDDAGNTTTVPQPGNWAASHNLKWDAWNRLVTVTNVSTTYQYDALFRRIVVSVSSTDHDCYYTDQWQVSEAYVGSTMMWRAFWGLRDLNDLIKRDGISAHGTSLYGLRDKLNFVAVTDTAGAVNLRLAYDTFGQPRYLTNAFAPGSNTHAWNFLFHGYEYDFQSGFYAVRYRTYHPTLGRWLSRDPIGERGGVNLYAFVENNPLSESDELGLEGECREGSYGFEGAEVRITNIYSESLLNTSIDGKKVAKAIAGFYSDIVKAISNKDLGPASKIVEQQGFGVEVCVKTSCCNCGVRTSKTVCKKAQGQFGEAFTLDDDGAQEAAEASKDLVKRLRDEAREDCKARAEPS